MLSKPLARALMIVCAGVISMGAASAQAKVAIVNFQKAIIETAEIKKAQTDLEAKYKPRTAELEKLQKELQDIQAQVQSGKLNQQAEQELQARGQRRPKKCVHIAAFEKGPSQESGEACVCGKRERGDAQVAGTTRCSVPRCRGD